MFEPASPDAKKRNSLGDSLEIGEHWGKPAVGTNSAHTETPICFT